MYNNIIIPVDHGNRNMKTLNFIYTSGLEESDTKTPIGEYLVYKKIYTLTERRIPYMRNKTIDNRFFILTLFGIGMESEKQGIYTRQEILNVNLPIGLPPKHYGALYQKFEEYFKRDEVIDFNFRRREYAVYLNDVMEFPQNYAAAITIFHQISKYDKVIVVDIGYNII